VRAAAPGGDLVGLSLTGEEYSLLQVLLRREVEDRLVRWGALRESLRTATLAYGPTASLVGFVDEAVDVAYDEFGDLLSLMGKLGLT
jgi:hypothetical protein